MLQVRDGGSHKGIPQRLHADPLHAIHPMMSCKILKV